MFHDYDVSANERISFECDADNEQDAQKILRLQWRVYVQTNEEPLVILEEAKSSAEEASSS